jgi:uncharacterized membrane protein
MTIPWVYLALIWNELPQNIPTHFGINGIPDKFGRKNEIIIAPLIFTIIGIVMYFILRNIHKIDPKKKYTATTSSILSKLSVVTIVLLCAVSIFICYSSLRGKVEGLPLFFCGLSLFLAYIGNLMHSIKPNYFAGFRLPWTLENEENWRKTHQLASKIWFTGGIILAVISLILKFKILIIVYMISIFIMTLIPVFYSYNLYRLSTKSTDSN